MTLSYDEAALEELSVLPPKQQQLVVNKIAQAKAHSGREAVKEKPQHDCWGFTRKSSTP